MLEILKKEVLEANLEIKNKGMVIYTWGNVSGIDRRQGLVVIKASGVSYEEMTEDHMVVLDLEGNVIEGRYRPSSDTPTHLALYKAFPEIGGITHTHSPWATAWAQASRDIPVYGTTHADYFYGTIPCTRAMKEEEIKNDYEVQTGNLIIRTIKEKGLDPLKVPGVLVSGHGPFVWGKNPGEAVYNAVVLEEVAKIAFMTENINSHASPICKALLDRHYFRKHGSNAYYGQK
ncbi:class II aldolase/adducin family protein [Thermoanaerobacter mathranii subsp. mathranii str. A3]|uniref:L-ribulose-5-phosphate 4-epimerase n=1 Tax=Thermoanaerobacter mathranii subsp. mathranii (strain DSM 11426 / CCUG 53645 / CIP 108742 / A3) TaxID=583358 RepID=A0ABM5LN40_THEM3|nr:L-ribulose-5-phosphate 4-epimerase [Thermoanaerobacter mathranii]ADH60124.1 class II aldolase/adducin family protein [Thermoanaerobacter mathranii subsp. mathranii str. A3]